MSWHWHIQFLFERLILLLVLFELFCVNYNHGQEIISPKAGCPYNKDDFEVLTLAIEEGLQFFQNHLNQVIFDAAMGARTAQAQLRLALSLNRTITQEMRSRLQELENLADNISLKVIKNVWISPKISLVAKIHQLPWVENVSLWMQPRDEWKSEKIMQKYETVDYKSIWDVFNGDLSDKCINHVFKCEFVHVTKECFDEMLSGPKYLYTLNHQIIYMLIARQRNCDKVPHFRANFVNEDLDLYLETLCSKVWHSARKIMSFGYYWGVRDLFTEQVGLCSMAGYPNFLRVDWLRKILSWRTSSGAGCFLDPSIISSESLLDFWRKNGSDFEDSKYPVKRRRKRGEVKIEHAETKETCYLHFTAVGIMAISIHLRHLIEICYL